MRAGTGASVSRSAAAARTASRRPAPSSASPGPCPQRHRDGPGPARRCPGQRDVPDHHRRQHAVGVRRPLEGQRHLPGPDRGEGLAPAGGRPQHPALPVRGAEHHPGHPGVLGPAAGQPQPAQRRRRPQVEAQLRCRVGPGREPGGRRVPVVRRLRPGPPGAAWTPRTRPPGSRRRGRAACPARRPDGGRTVPRASTRAAASVPKRRSSGPVSSPAAASPPTQTQAARSRTQSPRRPSGRCASTVQGSPPKASAISSVGSATASVTRSPATATSRRPADPAAGSPSTSATVTRTRVVGPAGSATRTGRSPAGTGADTEPASVVTVSRVARGPTAGSSSGVTSTDAGVAGAVEPHLDPLADGPRRRHPGRRRVAVEGGRRPPVRTPVRQRERVGGGARRGHPVGALQHRDRLARRAVVRRHVGPLPVLPGRQRRRVPAARVGPGVERAPAQRVRAHHRVHRGGRGQVGGREHRPPVEQPGVGERQHALRTAGQRHRAGPRVGRHPLRRRPHLEDLDRGRSDGRSGHRVQRRVRRGHRRPEPGHPPDPGRAGQRRPHHPGPLRAGPRHVDVVAEHDVAHPGAGQHRRVRRPTAARWPAGRPARPAAGWRPARRAAPRPAPPTASGPAPAAARPAGCPRRSRRSSPTAPAARGRRRRCRPGRPARRRRRASSRASPGTPRPAPATRSRPGPRCRPAARPRRRRRAPGAAAERARAATASRCAMPSATGSRISGSALCTLRSGASGPSSRSCTAGASGEVSVPACPTATSTAPSSTPTSSQRRSGQPGAAAARPARPPRRRRSPAPAARPPPGRSRPASAGHRAPTR